MRRVAVCLIVLCAAVGISVNAAAADKAETFDEWLDSQQGTCEENQTAGTGLSLASTKQKEAHSPANDDLINSGFHERSPVPTRDMVSHWRTPDDKS